MAEKITDTVIEKIGSIAYGYVFTASDFPIDVTKHKSVNKVLENLTKACKISRLSKGRYYKTKITEFGELLPDNYQIVKDLLTEKQDFEAYSFYAFLSFY